MTRDQGTGKGDQEPTRARTVRMKMFDHDNDFRGIEPAARGEPMNQETFLPCLVQRKGPASQMQGQIAIWQNLKHEVCA